MVGLGTFSLGVEMITQTEVDATIKALMDLACRYDEERDRMAPSPEYWQTHDRAVRLHQQAEALMPNGAFWSGDGKVEQGMSEDMKDACRLLFECIEEIRLHEENPTRSAKPEFKERLDAFLTKHGMIDPASALKALQKEGWPQDDFGT